MLITKIQEISTKRNILIGLVFTIASLMVIVLTSMTLNGIILDIRFSYSFQEVTELFASLGSEGLLTYSAIHVVDTFFPLANGFTMILAITYLTKNRTEGYLRYLAIIPILTIIFDFAENILIETQIAAYPILSEQVILFAGMMTGIKFICLLSGIFVIIILACMNYLKKK